MSRSPLLHQSYVSDMCNSFSGVGDIRDKNNTNVLSESRSNCCMENDEAWPGVMTVRKMLVFCYIVGAALVFLLILYLCLELHYFLRLLLAIILAKFCKKKVHILDEVVVRGICLTNDIDTFMYHMNNARFIRELDFARADLYQRTGLYPAVRRKGGNVAMGACTIRYRRFLKLFSLFIIKSKVVCWDEKSIFVQHQFITPNDNFVCAIVVGRTQILNCNAEEVMKELMAMDPTRERPEMPLEIIKWLEYNDISSAKLKADITSAV